MKPEQSLTPQTKINSKWIKELNLRLENIKLLEENISRTLPDINRSNLFQSVTQVMEIKRKIKK